MSTEEMEAVDYLLYRTDMDPHRRSAIMMIELLDVVPDWRLFRYDMDRASRLVTRFRQKVVAPHLPLASPEWVVDPDFNLDYHLRHIRVTEPGDLRQVLDLAQQLMASPLDPNRPLWEVTLIEGVNVEGAKAAMVIKVSHAITDGLGGIQIGLFMRSAERHPHRGPLPPLPVPVDVTPGDLTQRGLRRLPLRLATGTAKAMAGSAFVTGQVLRNPVSAVARAGRFAESVHRIAGPPPVEPSPLLQRRSLNRRFETVDVPLAALRAAARAAGCSVNDAYVSAVCGVLRRYHESLGMPVETMNLVMPVSLRAAGDVGAGNHWAPARIAAPIGMTDPAERMRVLRQLVAEGKEEPAIEVANAVAPVASRLPLALIDSLGSSALANDVQVSNVPGHPEPRYVGGAQVKQVVPIGSLPGPALMIVMLSQTGTCYIGAHYDTASINDHELFARCLRDGFAEVLALAPQPEPVPGADRPSPAVPPVPATDPVTRELVSAAATLSPAVKARPNGKRPRAREVVAAGTR